MRPLLAASVVLVSVVACGKSRLAGESESTAGWEEPTAANGFHRESDRACDFACVPRAEADRSKHAVRTSPSPRSEGDAGWVGQKDARARAAHGDEVCSIEANEWVKCAHAGADPKTVARSPGIDARFLAMDDRAFYVVRGGWIARLARGADGLDALARTASPVRDLALGSGVLYWTERGAARLECRSDGSMPSCTARDRNVRRPYGTLRGVRIADRRAELLAAELDEADGMLVLNDHVYVSTRQGLVRVPTHGGTPTVLPTGEPAFGRPALDPVSWTVYVQTRNNPDPPRIVALEP